jgi:hypothetical protein
MPSYTLAGVIPDSNARERVTDLIGTVWSQNYSQLKGSGVVVAPPTNDGFKTGFKRVTRDVVTPRFRSLSARGEVFNSPFTSVLAEYKGSAIPTWEWRYKDVNGAAIGSQIVGGGQSIRSQLSGVQWGPTWPHTDRANNPWPVVDDSRARLEAGTKAWAGVQEPEFDAPVFIAEARETYKMLTKPWESLWELILDVAYNRKNLRNRSLFRHPQFQKAFKKGQLVDEKLLRLKRPGKGYSTGTYMRNNGRAIAQYVGQNWLALRYGVMPLLGDIDDALSVLREEPTWGLRQTSRGAASIPLVTKNEPVVSITDNFFTGERYNVKTRELTVRAGVLYTQKVITNATRTGLNLSALPRAGWEAIPFSHVADWIWNVGDVLAALESKADSQVLASWTTTVDKRTERIGLRNTQPKPVQLVNYDISGNLNFEMTYEETVKTREPQAYIGLTRRSALLDMSKDKWRNRSLDVAAFAGGFISRSKAA